MLKSGRSSSGRRVVYVGSGRIDGEEGSELQRLWGEEAAGTTPILDLKGVRLVDAEQSSSSRVARKRGSDFGTALRTSASGSPAFCVKANRRVCQSIKAVSTACDDQVPSCRWGRCSTEGEWHVSCSP